MDDQKTRPFELRTKNESEQHETLDAFSPDGRETDSMRVSGDFLTELRLMKMTSPSLPIAAKCDQQPKSYTG